MDYKTRRVKVANRNVHVVYQHTKRTSAMSSVSNCFLLMSLLSLQSEDSTPSFIISSIDLIKLISQYSLKKAKLLPATVENKTRIKKFWDIIAKLPKKNPLVRPAPNSVIEFTDTPFHDLLSLLDIPLFHGSFIEHDILAIKNHIDEGQFGILYSNDEFHTIFKCNHNIYKLVVDEANILKYPTAVWESLDMANRFQLMTFDFSVASADINMKLHKCSSHGCSKEFYSRNNHQRHYNYHLPSFKADQDISLKKESIGLFWDEMSLEDAQSIMSFGFGTVKRFHGFPIQSMLREWVSSEEFQTAPLELNHALRLIVHFTKSSAKPSSRDLFDVLNVASEGGFLSTNVTQRKVELLELESSENVIWSMMAYFGLAVEEALVRRWYKYMTAKTQESGDQLVKDSFVEPSEGTKSSLDGNIGTETDWECKDASPTAAEPSTAKEDEVEDQIKTLLPADSSHLANLDMTKKILPEDISRLPPLEAEDYFPTFVHGKNLIRIYTLFSGGKAVGLTRIGRKLAKCLLKPILKAHKHAQCWNGDWDILDLRVRAGGVIITINKQSITATKDGVAADLQRFISLLAPYYKVEGMEGPAFFNEFHTDVMQVPELGSERFELFQKFVSHHLAFMPPLARSDLFDKLFRICDSLREEHNPCYTPLSDRPSGQSWFKKIKCTLPYSGVYNHNHPGGVVAKPYRNTYWDLLRFLRNFINHGLKHTKIDGIQIVCDIAVLDVMMSTDLGVYITKLLLVLMYQCGMKGRDETEENDED